MQLYNRLPALFYSLKYVNAAGIKLHISVNQSNRFLFHNESIFEIILIKYSQFGNKSWLKANNSCLRVLQVYVNCERRKLEISATE